MKKTLHSVNKSGAIMYRNCPVKFVNDDNHAEGVTNVQIGPFIGFAMNTAEVGTLVFIADQPGLVYDNGLRLNEPFQDISVQLASIESLDMNTSIGMLFHFLLYEGEPIVNGCAPCKVLAKPGHTLGMIARQKNFIATRAAAKEMLEVSILPLLPGRVQKYAGMDHIPVWFPCANTFGEQIAYNEFFEKNGFEYADSKILSTSKAPEGTIGREFYNLLHDVQIGKVLYIDVRFNYLKSCVETLLNEVKPKTLTWSLKMEDFDFKNDVLLEMVKTWLVSEEITLTKLLFSRNAVELSVITKHPLTVALAEEMEKGE